jgi:hypothetical protein
MSERTILSEKPEDNQEAAEWGRKQAELMKKGEEITKRLMEKYTPSYWKETHKRKRRGEHYGRNSNRDGI